MTPIRITTNGSSAGAECARLFVNAFIDRDQRTREAIATFKSTGYSSAHPDDGWVDRANSRVHLAYPYFAAAEIRPGDMIALGDVDRGFRKVRVSKVEDTIFGLRWYWFVEEGGV
jgi:hypothetical protein